MTPKCFMCVLIEHSSPIEPKYPLSIYLQIEQCNIDVHFDG